VLSAYSRKERKGNTIEIVRQLSYLFSARFFCHHRDIFVLRVTRMEFLGVSFSLLASCYSKHHNESWSTTHARVGYDQEFKTEEGDGDVLPEPTQQLKWAKRNKPRRNRYRSPPPYRLWKKIPSFFS
jgi:hypothetical protein